MIATSVLNTQGLTIGYRQPQHTLSRDLALTLTGGELVCLLGPNGAGKSTLLRTLAGMQPPLGGRISIMGRDVARLKPRELARLLSVVLTDRVSVGTLTAYALVALGRFPHTGWLGRLSPHDEFVVRWAIEAVGAGPLAANSVEALSDGERQKVMIARALAQEPRVMLLDEPTAFLDLPHRVEVMQTLRALARSTGQAILLSTHDLDLALHCADRLWLMAADGSIRSGAPEDLILSGAFEQTFQHAGVSFDAATGSFAAPRGEAGTVHLDGEGLPAVWTARALEREGYAVSYNGDHAVIRVAVDGTNSHTRWRVETADRRVEAGSIHELIDALRQDTPPEH